MQPLFSVGSASHGGSSSLLHASVVPSIVPNLGCGGSSSLLHASVVPSIVPNLGCGGSSFFSVGSAFDRYSLLKPTPSTPQGLKDAHAFTPGDLRRQKTARSDLTTSGDLLEWRAD
jgi:hypothetical protein